MKLRLLLGGLMLTAAANAQVATINENFNNFTAGNTAFARRLVCRCSFSHFYPTTRFPENDYSG